MTLERGKDTSPAAWRASPKGRAVYDSTLGIEEGCQLYDRLQEAQGRGLSMHGHTALLFFLVQVLLNGSWEQRRLLSIMLHTVESPLWRPCEMEPHGRLQEVWGVHGHTALLFLLIQVLQMRGFRQVLKVRRSPVDSPPW